MKIKVAKESYEEVCKKKMSHKNPQKPSGLARFLVRALSEKELKEVGFTWNSHGMELVSPKEPCLILMNHSSFIDLKICAHIFRDRPYNIVCTSDGFVGKEGLMRWIGCIPTQKFVPEMSLVRDLKYILHDLKSSVLMYPEASYSFDGTATPLPESVGKLIKIMKVPVVMVRTYGAFTRDPLYNGLQLRNVPVSADVTCMLVPEQIQTLSVKRINEILKEQFTFDHFRWQQENRIRVDEPFRADHLNRVLYKCPHCETEGQMIGKGTEITCESCGVTYELTEYGFLQCKNADGRFSHIPDWYRWERDCVREALQKHTYELKTKVKIHVLVDTKQIYDVGEGILTHTENGFVLDGCDGALHYEQSPLASYGLYADYFWYEIGDMICIGDSEKLFYCFPQDKKDVVAKTRLAAEELYQIAREHGKKEKTGNSQNEM